MAAINDKIKQMVTSATKTQGHNLTGLNTLQQPDSNAYRGLAGVSEGTQSQLGKYTQGYTPSQSVTAAQDYLNSVVSGKPGAYQNNYRQQLDDLYNQVMNRPKFSYDLGSDMLYQQYRDQYMNLGQQAMMYTTAQAAALTGGYGNSYAATAGNQAYQAYLQQLNNIVPDLYQMAMNRYQQEGEDLNNRYALTAELEGKDYSRYQDDYNKWLTERDYANTDYWNKYNADYGRFGDDRNFWATMAGQENSQYNTDRNMAYNQAMAILKTGKLPTSDLLEQAAITRSDAKKLANYYAGKSSGSKSSGSKSTSSSKNTTAKPASSSTSGYDGLSDGAKAVYNAVSSGMKTYGAEKAATNIAAHVEKGGITADEARAIKQLLGLA